MKKYARMRHKLPRLCRAPPRVPAELRVCAALPKVSCWHQGGGLGWWGKASLWTSVGDFQSWKFRRWGREGIAWDGEVGSSLWDEVCLGHPLSRWGERGFHDIKSLQIQTRRAREAPGAAESAQLRACWKNILSNPCLWSAEAQVSAPICL